MDDEFYSKYFRTVNPCMEALLEMPMESPARIILLGLRESIAQLNKERDMRLQKQHETNKAWDDWRDSLVK